MAGLHVWEDPTCMCEHVHILWDALEHVKNSCSSYVCEDPSGEASDMYIYIYIYIYIHTCTRENFHITYISH